jgi:anti-sigma regulatory factor (Ser/Thr protein kinase)
MPVTGRQWMDDGVSVRGMTATSEPASGVGMFVHEGLFYADADEYLAGLVPFVRAALDAGEPVMAAVPGPNLDLLRDALDGNADRVRFHDMTRAGRNPGRIIPWVLHAFISQHPGRHPHIIGEPIWAGRTADEYPACAQHEALINEAFAGVDATIVCPYDVSRLTPEVLTDAEITHPVLVDGDRRWPSRLYAPLDLVAAYNAPLPEPESPVATLPFDLMGLSAVRRFVAEHAGLAGLPADRIADLQIAVNELATNSVSYTDGTGTLRVWRSDGVLVCEVRDRGWITDPLAGRLPPPTTAEHGRGLVIVNHLCDLVRVHTDANGTTIRLHLLTTG